MLWKFSVQDIPIFYWKPFPIKFDFFKGGGNWNVINMVTKYNYLSEGTVVPLICDTKEKFYVRLQSSKLLQSFK